MGLAEQQTVYKCKQMQQPSKILKRFLNSALSLALAWVQRSAITHRVLRFGPRLRTPRGADLSTAGGWSLLLVPGPAGRVGAGGCCCAWRLAASWPPARCVGRAALLGTLTKASALG